MEPHERLSLVYPVKTQIYNESAALNRSVVRIESYPDPNFRPGRLVEIWHAGYGESGAVERRTLAADLGGGLFALDAPLSADLVWGEDVPQIVVK